MTYCYLALSSVLRFRDITFSRRCSSTSYHSNFHIPQFRTEHPRALCCGFCKVLYILYPRLYLDDEEAKKRRISLGESFFLSLQRSCFPTYALGAIYTCLSACRERPGRSPAPSTEKSNVIPTAYNRDHVADGRNNCTIAGIACYSVCR